MDRRSRVKSPSVGRGFDYSSLCCSGITGYIYVRADYHLRLPVWAALEQAREKGLLGKICLEVILAYIMIFQGSGAFVCGEETALISSLLKAAQVPNHRPPGYLRLHKYKQQ